MEATLTLPPPAYSGPRPEAAPQPAGPIDLTALERLSADSETGYSAAESLISPETSALLATEVERFRTTHPDMFERREPRADSVKLHEDYFGLTPESTYIKIDDPAEFADEYPGLFSVITQLGERMDMEPGELVFNFFEPGVMTPLHQDDTAGLSTTISLSLKGAGEIQIWQSFPGEPDTIPVEPGTAVRFAMTGGPFHFKSHIHAGLNPRRPDGNDGERISVGLIFYARTTTNQTAVDAPH
ncbi:MAG TPA: 2OG-Fe(II) oxygenase family protein [Candidatus Saccharimonadales bacterium]|nr:2OG-Fe(II) oxygenase family protein [Candidatus Saccharimonadales bacterium]